MNIKCSKPNIVSALIDKIFKSNSRQFGELSPDEANKEVAKIRNKYFCPHPAIPHKTLDFVDLIHIPQEMQFAIECLPLLTRVLQSYPKDQEVSLLDYGPGYCAGSNLFATLFKSNVFCCKVNVEAMDIRTHRKDLINYDYPLVNFTIGDIRDVPITKQWNVIYCSNVIEHLADPSPLIDALINHSNGWVIIYAPYEELPLSVGHVSTITKDTFRQFNPVMIEIIN